ncbi:MAG: hypothetical protein ABIG39_07495 [Candidatus Micrarchaeota archaeon]
MPPIYLGDALDILFGKKSSEEKEDFRKTTDSLKGLGWAFEKFDENENIIYFKKGSWILKLKA